MKKQNFPGKYEIQLGNSIDIMPSLLLDIFTNDFDITWHQPQKKNDPDRRIWTIIPGENAVDDGTITYRYNNDYFRCDNFKNDHTGMHILFAGCSETEGMGSNIEDSWGHMVFTELKKSHSVDGYYNIGKAGYGWQKAISQVMVYVSKYGKPDNLFILLPNMVRSIEWSEEVGLWYVKQKHPNFNEDGSPTIGTSFYESDLTPEEYKKAFIDFVISWKLFEDYCIEAGINMLWGTWQDIDNYNLSKLKIFKNFVPLPKQDLLDNIEEYRENAKLRNGDMNKRDYHHGRLYHEYWAKKMLTEAKARGFLDD